MQRRCSAIIFDLGGVILNIDYNATINAFKELGKSNFETLYQQAHQDRIFDQFEVGAVSAQEFRDYLKSFLPQGTTDEQINKAWNVMLLDLPAKRVDLLKRLANSHRLFLFSNTNEIHLVEFREIIRRQYDNANLLEELFEKTYYSHLLEQRKPNAEAFQFILDQNHLDPMNTLFIDDSEQHIEGAKKVGLETYLLQGEDIVDIFE